MNEVVSIRGSCPSQYVDHRLTGHATTLRFAVATFDTWGGLRSSLQSLMLDGLDRAAVSLLGKRQVLFDVPSNGDILASTPDELPFPENRELICCTRGLLAERLAEQLQAGATTLKSALSRWLIPRHAAEIENAVELGRIVLWVQLFDNEGEHQAYRRLLAGTSHSVGVHDLVDE
jgi:hypothetical protein